MSPRETAGVREIEAQRDLMASRAAEYAGELAEAQLKLKAAEERIAVLVELKQPDPNDNAN